MYKFIIQSKDPKKKVFTSKIEPNYFICLVRKHLISQIGPWLKKSGSPCVKPNSMISFQDEPIV